MTPAQLSVAFFLQMFVIIATCRAVGWVAKKYLGQPQVVGEMIAGVILGPSLFGLLAPDIQHMLFPKESKTILYVGAQLGVGLYMFLVGLGFRSEHFKSNAKSAAAVSISGMAAPFLVAVAIAPWLLSQNLFGKGIDTFQATLFMGAAISITAFPMLARIIYERGLTNTPLGTLSLSAGAIDDAGAWTVLAIVLASFGGGPMVAVKAIVGGVAFVVLMLTLGPKLLAPLGRWAEREGKVSPSLLGVVLMLFMLSAFAMDAIGIHAVFGGFILGTVMPRGVLSREIKKQLEPFAVIVLLPMFFTFSGLNTQLNMVNNVGLLLVAAVILLGSILAKGGACWAAARLTGQDNPTALGIGALMNSRGLMELIIINIGLQRGIIGPALFSMLVLMAIVTTLMASPMFELVYGKKARERGELGALNEDEDDAPPVLASVRP
ncbi:potassium transporter [Caulobacter sp. Root655]|uniref:cation:proton antiporter n=1 Tax=Caulobacter sp. Root655 TaxID=1736578 RepID=UPI0006FDFCFE|nr:cation:proton antiporter [Caulobacter sp. Root655]KRA59670.1 potassium transporter [Caulobacter sp. Root655]